MAVFDLSGGGIHALTPGTTHLFVQVLVYGAGYSTGLAVPTNYFHLGLLRLGVQGGFYPVIPIDAPEMRIDCPVGATDIGYSLQTTTSIRVTEDFS
jgi:hypothetical protein